MSKINCNFFSHNFPFKNSHLTSPQDFVSCNLSLKNSHLTSPRNKWIQKMWWISEKQRKGGNDKNLLQISQKGTKVATSLYRSAKSSHWRGWPSYFLMTEPLVSRSDKRFISSHQRGFASQLKQKNKREEAKTFSSAVKSHSSQLKKEQCHIIFMVTRLSCRRRLCLDL